MVNKNTSTLAVTYLLQNEKRILWYLFAQNVNDIAVDYMLSKKHKLLQSSNYYSICCNYNDKMVQFLLNHPEIYDDESVMKDNLNPWMALSANKHPDIYKHILSKNWEKCDIYWLSMNENKDVFNYLLDNPAKIRWITIWQNPNIFE